MPTCRLHVQMGQMLLLMSGFEARPPAARSFESDRVVLLVANHGEDVRYLVRTAAGEHSFPAPVSRRSVLLLWPVAAEPPATLSPRHLFGFEKGELRWPTLGFGPPGSSAPEHPWQSMMAWRDPAGRFRHSWSLAEDGADDYAFEQDEAGALWWWLEGETQPLALHGAPAATARGWVEAGLAREEDLPALEALVDSPLQAVLALDGRPSQQGDGSMPYPPK